MTDVSATIPKPDDWHVHLRDGEMLEAVTTYTAKRFRYAMIMPNLVPPIVSTSEAVRYRDRILAGMSLLDLEIDPFAPWMTLYCSHDIDLDDLRNGIAANVIGAVKYYPAGATTNSESGGTSMAEYTNLFAVLADTGTRLLVHAESTDPAVDIFDREAVFLERQLAPLMEAMPELRVTVEHVSTAAGVDLVESMPQAAATITPHHLARDRSDLLANGMKPDLYCKPVINSEADQRRLIEAATSGASEFMLGTDSAPHPTTAKYGPTAKAGVFNAAYGLEVVAEVFYQADKLDMLPHFVSINGQNVYGVPAPVSSLTLTRSTVPVERATEMSTSAGDSIVLFGAEEAALWEVALTGR